ERTKRHRKTKRSAASIRVATLNMKGRGQSIPTPSDPRGISAKWLAINQLVREQKTAVLAIQETHLSNEHVDDLQSLFGNRIHIIHSPAPERPTANAGVAFVLNKERLEVSLTTSTVVIPGRAMALNLVWHNDVPLTILNVYAPNSPTENERFWRDIAGKISRGECHKPDIILGDFNVVEDSSDRLPPHPDHRGATQALSDLYTSLGLLDAWRNDNPSDRLYTYVPDNGSALSRLDRIYLNQRHARTATDWAAEPIAGIPTDHLMVSVSLSDARIPFVGPGRWVIPKTILSDYSFTKYVMEKGRQLLDAFPSPRHRDNTCNAQTLWTEFKSDLRHKARALAKINIPKLAKRIEKLKVERHRILNIRDPPSDFDVPFEAALLQQRIKSLEARRFGQARSTVALSSWIHGERLEKPWIAVN
ncbi:DNase I-like protein, partial [Trametopsis cervina]